MFGGKSREPETEITAREMDIASSIQKVTEKIIYKMAIYAKKITFSDALLEHNLMSKIDFFF